MSWLLNEYPLLVMPTLATKVGLNESIVLQQIHYWIVKSDKEFEGRKWTYNSYEEWGKQFPFWSTRTIRRIINNLENDGLIIADNFNRLSFDRTKWYTIDYLKLKERLGETPLDKMSQWNEPKCPNASGQVVLMEEAKVSTPIPDISSNTTTNTTSNSKDIVELDSTHSQNDFYIDEIIKYLNLKTGKQFKTTTKEYRKHISGRLTAGATLEQFKHVIDVKCNEWLNDSKMKQHLTPTTLFRESNFDRYLNQELIVKEKNLRDMILNGEVDFSNVTVDEPGDLF